MNWYSLAADLIVVLHLLYLAFTVGGAGAIFLGALFQWNWVRLRLFRIIHLAATLFVAFEALIGMWCPLTVWEFRLRQLAGESGGEQISFVGRLIRKILFYDLPAWFFLLLYLGFGGLVLLSYILIPPVQSAGGGSPRQ